MAFRNFSVETEALAGRWIEMIESPDRWTLGERVSSDEGKNKTESDPFYAYCGHLRCIAKPSAEGKPRAAIEKVVSDLAFHLGLPVMPVLLWNPENGVGSDYMALVAYAFEPAYTWADGEPKLSPAEKAATIATFSAVSVFETWISAQDRDAGKHVLINLESGTLAPQMAFIDYAYSLSFTWTQNEDPVKAAPSSFPTGKDDRVVQQMVEKINNLDDCLIKSLVERVPLPFLPADQRDITLNNLLSRKRCLKDLLKP